MTTKSIGQALEELRNKEPYVISVADEFGPGMILSSLVSLPTSWDKAAIESSQNVVLPPELEGLWNVAAEIRLLDDTNYGQWGCILWSPAELIAGNKKSISWRRPTDWRSGDLIIGEFRGDSDLLVLRCDPTDPDYGAVVIAVPIEKRKVWPCVAKSLVEFIQAFVSQPGRKFWESSGPGR